MTSTCDRKSPEELKERFSSHFKGHPDVDWTKVHEDDSGELICDVCGEAKTMSIPRDSGEARFIAGIFGGYRIYSECRCDRTLREEAERQEEADRRRETVSRLKRALALAPEHCDATFANLERRDSESFNTALDRARRYCEAWPTFKEPYGIYFTGDRGCGKTSIMAAMANELIERHLVRPAFFQTQDLMEAMGTRDGRARMLEAVRSADILFLDDIGSERFVNAQGYDLDCQSLMYDVIDARCQSRKSTVFSSNYSIGELEDVKGLRGATADRIFMMSSVILKIDAPSFRKMMRTRMTADMPF